MPTCGACGKDDAQRRCSACKAVHYCDQACQKAAWSTHKKACRPQPQPQPQPPQPTSSPQPQPLDKRPRIKGLGEWVPCTSAFVPPPGYTGAPNLLILLHGAGDRAASLVPLATRMALPLTDVLCLNGIRPLPAFLGMPGSMWYPSFDEQDGSPLSPSDPRQHRGLAEARAAVLTTLKTLADHGWEHRYMFLMGLGQGGLVAADVALSAPHPLGGAVSVGGGAMLCNPSGSTARGGTPLCGPYWTQRGTSLLLMHGSAQDDVPLQAVEAQVSALKEYAERGSGPILKVYPGDLSRLLKDGTQMHDLYAFLAPKMQSALGDMAKDPASGLTAVAPEHAAEVTRDIKVEVEDKENRAV